MGELVLVRHAQASFGTEDYDRLSPLGLQQADWLGAYFNAHDLQFDRVLRGDLRRHRETASGIASRHSLPEVEVDPRLNEFHYDGLEKRYLAATGTDAPSGRPDFLQLFPQLLTSWETGELDGAGESYAEFQARIHAALDDALDPGKTVLVVTSGGVIGVAIRRALNLSPEATADVILCTHNASVHRFIWEGDRLRLALFNACPHLDPQDRVFARTYI
ncbi:histidine phosphatase family protein [Halovulum sp. GXIMD14793]